jgi:hypothetical protein
VNPITIQAHGSAEFPDIRSVSRSPDRKALDLAVLEKGKSIELRPYLPDTIGTIDKKHRLEGS